MGIWLLGNRAAAATTLTGPRIFTVLVITIYLVAACGAPPAPQDASGPLPTSTASPVTLTLQEISLEEGLIHFEDAMSQEILASVNQLDASGIKSIYTLARYGLDDAHLTAGPAVVLAPEEDLEGYVLLIDALDHAHRIGLLTTLDYQPIQVEFNETLGTLPMVDLEPGQRRAYRFSLPPLPEGLHTLVITYVVDPFTFFDFESRQLTPPEGEAMGLRDGPFEYGLLIWVTRRAPEAALDWPPATHPLPAEDTARIMQAVLRHEAPGPGEPEMFFHTDTVASGETLTYAFRILAARGKGQIPIRLLAFWDDHLYQTSDVVIEAEAGQQAEFMPYQIGVPPQLSSGEHYLTVVAYPYPYYLRGWLPDPAWRPNVGAFSHLAARVPITVVATP